LGVYRANLLKPSNIVLDLVASTVDSCIIASKRIGEKGMIIAIEPNNEDYPKLEMNIEMNNCKMSYS
jgi:23S rRNA U2552 (ribose-2'-O)-methylase RlmE/FtsJ